jgi:hypothetical protein
MPGQEAVVDTLQAGPTKSGIGGFIATPGGKVVVIGAALATLLVVLGAVAAIVLLTLGKQVETVAGSGVSAPPAATARAVSSTSSVEGTEAAVPVIPVTNRDVFTERDPFEPVIEPTKTVEPSAATSESVALDTLTLQGIVEQDGVLKAVLTFNGTTYTAAANERLGDTPWQVLSVGKQSATMLFGDVQVTLSMGEGVAK